MKTTTEKPNFDAVSTSTLKDASHKVQAILKMCLQGTSPKLSSTTTYFFNDLHDIAGMCFYGEEFSPPCTEACFGTEFNEDRCKILGDARKAWFSPLSLKERIMHAKGF